MVSLSYGYVHSRRVGAEVALHGLNVHLVQAGADVTALTANLTQKTTVDGVHVRTAVHPRPPADVVVVNAGLAGQAATWWPGARLVVWVHNTEPATLLDVRAAAAKSRVELLANTQVSRTVLLACLGLDSQVLHPPVPHADPVTGGTAVTLINCTPAKGSQVFWDLAVANPDREFLAVRGGYGEQDIRSCPNVEIIDHGALDDVWSRTRVLLVPSRLESYSMVAVEAATRGVPVLARDLPGIREAVGSGAIYTHTDWQHGLQLVDEQWDALSDGGRCHTACLDSAAELNRVTTTVLGAFRVTDPR